MMHHLKTSAVFIKFNCRYRKVSHWTDHAWTPAGFEWKKKKNREKINEMLLFWRSSLLSAKKTMIAQFDDRSMKLILFWEME